MLRIIGFIGLLVTPQIGVAQALSVAEADVRACFSDTPFGTFDPACLGDAANQCQGLPGGSTTIGITDCIGAETAIWDAALNETYQQVRDNFERVGGEDLTISLRDAQRAWIAFRDAECAMQYQKWIEGSIRTVVAATCRMRMTAHRALTLRYMTE